MEDRCLYRITIRGRVQGVGFRWKGAQQAGIYNLDGFIMNTDDGAVYVEVEGPRSALNSFLEWCRTGPALSSVKSVDYVEGPPEGHSGFRVLR